MAHVERRPKTQRICGGVKGRSQTLETIKSNDFVLNMARQSNALKALSIVKQQLTADLDEIDQRIEQMTILTHASITQNNAEIRKLFNKKGRSIKRGDDSHREVRIRRPNHLIDLFITIDGLGIPLNDQLFDTPQTFIQKIKFRNPGWVNDPIDAFFTVSNYPSWEKNEKLQKHLALRRLLEERLDTLKTCRTQMSLHYMDREKALRGFEWFQHPLRL
jgi:hypothetical protein